MMRLHYPEAFKEQALIKAFFRGDRSVRSVAEELNMSFYTLKYWVKTNSTDSLGVSTTKQKRPQDWSPVEQLQALQETYVLSGDALQTWCRQRGLFAHHLISWKAAFCADGQVNLPDRPELRTLRDENTKLKRDAIRKDRALAEAAAPLILQKKFQALWVDEDK